MEIANPFAFIPTVDMRRHGNQKIKDEQSKEDEIHHAFDARSTISFKDVNPKIWRKLDPEHEAKISRSVDSRVSAEKRKRELAAQENEILKKEKYDFAYRAARNAGFQSQKKKWGKV